MVGVSCFGGCAAVPFGHSELDWQVETGSEPIFTQPTVVNDRVLSLGEDGVLSYVAAENGKIHSQRGVLRTVGAMIEKFGDRVLFVSDRIVLFSDDGHLLQELEWGDQYGVSGVRAIRTNEAHYVPTDRGSIYKITSEPFQTERVANLNGEVLSWELFGGGVLVTTDNFELQIVDLETGRERLSLRTAAQATVIDSSDEILTQIADNDGLMLAKINPNSGEPSATARLPGIRSRWIKQVGNQIAILLGQSGSRPDVLVYADSESVTIEAEYRLPAQSNPPGAGVNGRVVLSCLDGSVVSVSPSDGVSVLYEHTREITSPLTVSKEAAFFADRDGNLSRLSV